MASDEKKALFLTMNGRSVGKLTAQVMSIVRDLGASGHIRVSCPEMEADESLLRECLDMLGRSCAISCPECGASGYNHHAENCQYLILMRKLSARLGGEG